MFTSHFISTIEEVDYAHIIACRKSSTYRVKPVFCGTHSIGVRTFWAIYVMEDASGDLRHVKLMRYL